MLHELRTAVEEYQDAPHEGRDEFARDCAEHATKLASELLNEPTNVQALALARLMRDRPHSGGCSINTEAFDLPKGYWLVTFTLSGFECGIAPDGSVSS